MSEIDPADITAVPQRISESFNPELVDISPAAADRKKLEREGLPPGYRMRADAHYVDQLTSRRGERPSTDPVRGLDKAGDAQAWTDQLLTQLSEEISTIESAALSLSNDASPVARRVNLDLIKMQAWRASWLLRANAILQGGHRPQMRPRPLAFLLGQIRTAFAPECRLSGVGFQVQASDWNAVVAVDESGLLAGVAAAVFATLALVDQSEGVTIKLIAQASDGELRTIDVMQDEVMVPAGATAGFFDPSAIDRGAPWSARLTVPTVKTVARQRGGDALFLTTNRGGSLIRLQLTRVR